MIRKQNRYALTVISIALMLAANHAVAEQFSKRVEAPTIAKNKITGPTIAQERIKAAGGYKFTVPGVGKFVMSKIQSIKHPNQKCRVDLDSVKKILANRYKMRKAKQGINEVVLLRAWIVVETGETVCHGPGRGCRAIVQNVRSNVAY